MKVTLKAHNLRWCGKGRLKFAPVSFSIKQGEIFGLFGDAQSQNAEVVRILSGNSQPVSGSLNVLGTTNLASVRPQIGSTYDLAGFIADYSIEKNIRLVCSYKNVRPKEAVKLLQLFDLWNSRDKLLAKCTQEQKKRVAIICALMGNPDIILLDRPLKHLRKGTAMVVCKLLERAAANGQTVFITDEPNAAISNICTQALELEKPLTEAQIRKIKKAYLRKLNKKAS